LQDAARLEALEPGCFCVTGVFPVAEAGRSKRASPASVRVLYSSPLSCDKLVTLMKKGANPYREKEISSWAMSLVAWPNKRVQLQAGLREW